MREGRWRVALLWQHCLKALLPRGSTSSTNLQSAHQCNESCSAGFVALRLLHWPGRGDWAD